MCLDINYVVSGNRNVSRLVRVSEDQLEKSGVDLNNVQVYTRSLFVVVLHKIQSLSCTGFTCVLTTEGLILGTRCYLLKCRESVSVLDGDGTGET